MPDDHQRPTLNRRQTRVFLKSASPIIATHCLIAVLQFTDAAMLAPFGPTVLGALGLAASLLIVPTTFGYGLVTSVNTCVAQAHSRHTRIQARCMRFGVQGIWLGLIFGALALALLPTARVIFTLFGYEAGLVSRGGEYFEIALFGVPFQVAAAAMAGYFIGTGKEKTVLYGAAISTASNIALNYIFIFGAFGLPSMGLKGAAIGTVWASAIHFAFALTCFIRGLGSGEKDRADWRPRRRTLLRLCRIGWPLGVQDGIDILSWGFVILLIGHFGEPHLAAATIIVRCIHLSFLPADGLGIALSNAVSDAIGKGRPDLARAYCSKAFKITAIYMTSVAALLLLFRFQILRGFSGDQEVVRIGAQAMIFACAAQFFDAMNITYYCALLGSGDNLWPMRVTFATTILLLGCGGLMVIHLFPQGGSMTIWFLDAVYVAILGLTFRNRWRSGRWKDIDIFDE